MCKRFPPPPPRAQERFWKVRTLKVWASVDRAEGRRERVPLAHQNGGVCVWLKIG